MTPSENALGSGPIPGQRCLQTCSDHTTFSPNGQLHLICNIGISNWTEKRQGGNFAFCDLTLGGTSMIRKTLSILGLGGILLSLGAVSTISAGDDVPFQLAFGIGLW